MKLTKIFPDGIERKLTIAEFFKENLKDDQPTEIISKSRGSWIRGTAKYCIAHLDKCHYSACVQDATDNEGIITVYVR